MVVTKHTKLPTEEELTVEEINVSSPVLLAAAFQFGKYCEWQRNEYLLCKKEEDDPTACLNEGKAVTACGLEFLRKIKKHCRKEFEQYAHCIDFETANMQYYPCRKTQAVYDKCVLEKLNVERPDMNYYAEMHVHDTNRPKKYREPPQFPDALPGLKDDGTPLPPGRFGARF
ncbi:NADH dehydrogenase [ubiquinone] 1 alpha subcomplex subunit 8 [Orussus abietinus]|uniref:NADH dehydrogenase [ubiquinone] 1 alpha subcomplex subunit 8 n=1 Tax=Orussus abietinus TaxID=222816 RepID=UPI000626C0C5|nr:NADH dehydrogenase [ubiquinone] 1 alpha subcomplex subunit 8 [Orussus abietinus]